MKHVSQIDLLSAIWRELDRQGFKSLVPRQMGACVEAANLIVKEVGIPERKSIPNMGLALWWRTDDTGLSSEAMARVLGLCIGYRAPYGPRRPEDANAIPQGPSDFGRCVRLLDAEPRLREHLHCMADVSDWRPLIEAWDELEALYREEFPTGRAPRLYARMRELRTCGAGGERGE